MQINASCKSMCGEEVARQIIIVLSTELGIPSNLLIAAMRDRASVNSVAMRTVSIVYNKVMDVGCFSHTLDHVGEHMKTPVLDEFQRPGLDCLHIVHIKQACPLHLILSY